MIQRLVRVKLKPAHSGPGTLRHTAEETRTVLADTHDIAALEVALATNNRMRREWDLCSLARFSTIADAEAYRTDKLHRADDNVSLAPMRQSPCVWNFELPSSERGDTNG